MSMDALRSAALAALLACSAPAFAGVAGTFNVTVTPEAVKMDGAYNASYTEQDVANPLQDGFYVSYTVSVSNIGKNTANDVVFVGKAFATDGAEKPVYVGSTNQACSSSAAEESVLEGNGAKIKWVVTVTCPFGQMKAKSSIQPFQVTFATPKKDEGGEPPVADAPNTDKLSFNSVTYYAEGGNDVPTGLPNSTHVANADPVVLGTATSKNIRSTLLGDRTYKTGPIGTDILDQIKTSVSVPSVTGVYTIDIDEQPTPKNDRDCVNFSRCYVSTTTIEGYTTPDGQFMIFEINVGKAVFKNNFSPLVVIVVEGTTRLNQCEPTTPAETSCILGQPALSADGSYLIVKVRKKTNGPLFIR